MLWLVTPVFGRVELTRICFEQRARMLNELRALGIEADQLVVGDDDNLDTAREFGFQILERPNVLGRRVNDGFEWACREGGATHVAYCGSDDWHLAGYFAGLSSSSVKTCRWQAFVAPAGNRLVIIRQMAAAGGAPWVIPRARLEPCNYRPTDDKAMRGVDASTADGLYMAAQMGRRTWDERHEAVQSVFAFDEGADPLRMVDFKGGGEQITTWERVTPRQLSLELDTCHPFETLATRYPVDLCERMEKFYAEKGAQ